MMARDTPAVDSRVTTLPALTSTKRRAEFDHSEHGNSSSKKNCSLPSICASCKHGLRKFCELDPAVLRRTEYKKGFPMTDFQYGSEAYGLCIMLRGHLMRAGVTEPTRQVLHAFSFIRIPPIVRMNGGDKTTRRYDTVYLKTPGEQNQEVVFILPTLKPPTHAFLPQVVEPDANLSCCKEWVQYCRNHYNQSCRQPEPLPANLSLIDCESLKVMNAARNTSYVALSFVWGPKITDDTRGFPRTIKDAITVTRSLYYKYLWVDRYCIEQGSTAKHEQISQMDLVYSAADVTIVAAAGTLADFGLPGVSAKRHCRQSLQLDGYIVMECPEVPHTAVPKTTWSTRAWILQGAFLSRRRLVFTMDQTYFECAGMNCCESLLKELMILYHRNTMKVSHRPGIFAGKKRYSERPGSGDWELKQNRHSSLRNLIKKYTSGHLTHTHTKSSWA